MASDLTPFHDPTQDAPGFEDYSQENGHCFWWKSDLQQLLGYVNPASFDKAVGKAMAACTALGIPVHENFEHVSRPDENGGARSDVKLSRFACYLTAMNADPRKPQVASAQAYFATLAEFARQYILHSDGVERVLIRDELSDREKSLSGVAHAAGVGDYALFQNAGYRGLYNKNLAQLKALKGVVDGRSLLDFMGREELAANLFRITQTEAKIKHENVRGQFALEKTATNVGREVREAIRKIGGTMPEDLPISEDIKQVRSGIKKIRREFQQIDKKKKLPRRPKPPAE